MRARPKNGTWTPSPARCGTRTCRACRPRSSSKRRRPPRASARRHLAVHLPGARVADVDLIDPRAVQSPDAATFVTRLRGLALGDVHRRAKYLLVDLSDGQHLVIHRRMTGNLFLRPGGAPPDA